MLTRRFGSLLVAVAVAVMVVFVLPPLCCVDVGCMVTGMSSVGSVTVILKLWSQREREREVGGYLMSVGVGF